MPKSRRNMVVWLALMLVLTIGLAGCTSKGETAESADQQPTAANTTEASTKTDEASGETRVVKDEFGDVTIPVHPKRVAGIYLEDYLKALGITPVVQWYHPSWGKQDYLALDVPTFDTTGSLEALLDKKPDLIIVDGAVDAAKYELYSKIAPTYRLPERILDSPPDILKTIADITGMPEKADSVLKAYEQKIADVKAKLHEAVGNQTVAVVRLNIGEKTLALFSVKNRYIGNIYTELGLTPHPYARDMAENHAVLSEEKIPDVNADHIILFPSNGSWTSEENQESIKYLENSLWKSMPAVKNGHVHIAERSHWQSGAITANMMKMDDLLKWFVK
ncbi:ABC transporter substrate-binding protein [Paenibacillus guangzhouensis]|uniref:ABC transporter substrate-binding protein n=1 Tax=Paenibacillus guangzhouensis TaxID=1473112 RepID=UPI0012678089|nr:ABC transporter substrate-binding protein [Paenibacillus guangzhouensis]